MSATLPLPAAVAGDTTEVTFDVRLTTGVGPTSPVTIPVQGA